MKEPFISDIDGDFSPILEIAQLSEGANAMFELIKMHQKTGMVKMLSWI